MNIFHTHKQKDLHELFHLLNVGTSKVSCKWVVFHMNTGGLLSCNGPMVADLFVARQVVRPGWCFWSKIGYRWFRVEYSIVLVIFKFLKNCCVAKVWEKLACAVLENFIYLEKIGKVAKIKSLQSRSFV